MGSVRNKIKRSKAEERRWREGIKKDHDDYYYFDEKVVLCLCLI